MVRSSIHCQDSLRSVRINVAASRLTLAQSASRLFLIMLLDAHTDLMSSSVLGHRSRNVRAQYFTRKKLAMEAGSIVAVLPSAAPKVRSTLLPPASGAAAFAAVALADLRRCRRFPSRQTRTSS